jgi:hypothetical protein
LGQQGLISISSHQSNPRWSDEVTEHSSALDLEHGVFEGDDPKTLARAQNIS